jgi:hypothetical protein
LNEGADVIDMLGLQDTIQDLTERVADKENRSTARKLKSAILKKLGADNVFQVRAEEFNCEAENYYRTDLMRHHMREALHFLSEDVLVLSKDTDVCDGMRANTTLKFAGVEDPVSFVESESPALVHNESSFGDVVAFIRLTLLTIHRNANRAEYLLKRGNN